MQAVEDFMVHLFEDCNLCAIHAKRVTISELHTEIVLYALELTPRLNELLCIVLWLWSSFLHHCACRSPKHSRRRVMPAWARLSADCTQMRSDC
jgi:hypothetical protein